MSLSGNWNSQEASVLMVGFEKCDPEVRSTCKPHHEVKQWLKDKYILMVYNKQNFVTDGFGQKLFERYS